MAIKYLWLAERLRERIKKGIESGNNRLPSENQLSQKYRVSRQTVRTTLTLLEQEGLITKKHGSGSYLTGRLPDIERDTIGILISSSQEYIYPTLIHDIQSILTQNGFPSQVYTTDNRFCTEREILHKLLQNPPRCILVEGCKSALPNPNLDLYEKLRAKGSRIIFFHNYYPALHDSLFIKDDNIQGSTLLVQYLAEQGHRKIGGIFSLDDLQGVERFQGFMETMRDLDLPVVDESITWFSSKQLHNLQKEHDTHFLQKAVQEALSSCTAVVCYNDEIAFWLMKVLKQNGYHLPQDMAIVAFDNSYFSKTSPLPLTSLFHNPHEMANNITSTAINQLKGLPTKSMELPWMLSIRHSSRRDEE